MRFRLFALLFAAMALQWLSPQTMFGWGAHGHQITARIAAKHLTGAARSKVFELLKDDPKAKAILKDRSPDDTDAIADAMAAVAMFADIVKNTTAQETREWHFHDLAKDDGSAEAAGRCPNNDCVTVRLRQLLDGLKNGMPLQTSNNTFQAAAQLKFAIHFFGDIHQPLHCATNADAGGNCLKTEPDFGASQLHATWDGGLVDILFRDDHGHALTELQVARSINMRFGGRFAGIVQKQDVLEIALESHDAAFEKAYGPVIGANLVPLFPFKRVSPKCTVAPLPPQELQDMDPVNIGELYDETTFDAVAEQLAKGGFRLADALNRAFQ
jgi:S1/P1 nuclease